LNILQSILPTIKFFVKILLYLLIAAFVIFLFTFLFYPEWYYDLGHKDSYSKLEANYIPFGTNGNPSQTDYPLSASNIPGVPLSGIQPHPRLNYLVGCENFKLPDKAQGVYVVTDHKEPNQVLVSIPPVEGGGVDICVPGGTEAYIIIWAKIRN